MLSEAEQEGAAPVSPGHVAERLDRSAATATEMLQRLESRGLLTYEPYNGATLRDDGRETAADLHETYRTLLRFFGTCSRSRRPISRTDDSWAQSVPQSANGSRPHSSNTGSSRTRAVSISPPEYRDRLTNSTAYRDIKCAG